MSSEAETKARLSSESLPDNFFAASFSGGQNASPKPDVLTSSSAYTPHSVDQGSSLPQSPTGLKTDSTNERSTKSSDEKPSLPLFWRSDNSSNKPSEPKEVHVVAPFGEKSKGKKTYVKSLLEQITGKTSSRNEANVVDEDLVKGIFPVHQSLSIDDPERFPENNIQPEGGSYAGNQNAGAAKISQTVLLEESEDQSITILKDVPKPTPRVQSAPNKGKSEEKVMPPKPTPRSGKADKTVDSGSSTPTSTPKPHPAETSMPETIIEKVSRVGATPVDSNIHSGHVVATKKIASPMIEEYSYRLEELPVIPENPETASDDEQLDFKSKEIPKGGGSAKPPINDQSYSSEDSKGKPCDVTSVVMAEVEMRESAHQQPPEITDPSTYPSSTFKSISLPNDKTNTSSTSSPANPTIDVSDKVESTGKKLLRAWVSPSETHPIPTVQNGAAVSSRQR